MLPRRRGRTVGGHAIRVLRHSKGIGVLATALLVLSGCSASEGTVSGVTAPVRVEGVGPLPSHNFFAALVRSSRDLGPVRSEQRVSFLLLLKDPTAARRAAALAAMYDPHSKQFRQFQSPRQWAAEYGPVPSRVGSARIALQRDGLATSWQRGNDWMVVAAPAGTVERVFAVRIHRYVAPGGARYWATRIDPVIPAWLSPVVAGTGHISNYVEHHARAVPVNGLSPTDILKAYDMVPLRSQNLDGSGVTVAFIEIDGFSQSDFDGFTSMFKLPKMKPQIKFGSALSNVDGEAELDMEVVHEIAPAAKLTVYNCAKPCTDSDFVQAETQAVHDTPHGIISISLGGCESASSSGAINAEKSAFDQAEGLGESVLVASGDSGAFGCLSNNWGHPPTPDLIGASDPATIPSVTSVGGTRLSVNRDGSYYREETWEDPTGTAGTGGGLSVYFKKPSWQKGPGVDNNFNTTNARETPDVSAVADPATSAQIDVQGHFIQEGGTSQAAPIWAGMMALIDQYLGSKKLHEAGFLNPALYALAGSTQRYPPFHDITVGTNLVYPATAGYDLATGLGTPDAWNLARDLEAYIRGGH